MNIYVGSTNEVKLQAVRETIRLYPLLEKASVHSFSTLSGVSEQPTSMEETIRGATYRARASLPPLSNMHELGSIAIGIESGLMSVPFTRTGWMDFCAVAVMQQGQNYPYIGLSSAFECPQAVIDRVFKPRSRGEAPVTLNEAFLRAGLTSDPKLGNGEGAVGMLTNGRVNRKEYTKQALTMAFIYLEMAINQTVGGIVRRSNQG